MVEFGSVPGRLGAVDLARLAAPLQADTARFQVYFGEDVDQIVAEIEGVTAWREHAVAALDGDRLVGWLIAERDDELGRVWWWGDSPVTLHRVLVHVTANTQRHAGHADILRESVDGAVGL